MPSNVDKKEGAHPPSYWQRKFKKRPNDEKDGRSTDMESLEAWIAATQAKAEELNLLPSINEPFDDEVAFLVKQMESLLSQPQTEDICSERPLQSNDDDDFCFDFNLSGMEPLDPLNRSILDSNIGLESNGVLIPDKGLFSTDHIVTLFQNCKREKLERLCLRSLAMHSNREKKRLSRTAQLVYKRRQGKILGNAFLLWKSHCRIARVKQAALVLKFGRCASKRFRRAFAAWKELATTPSAVETEAVDMCRNKMLTRSFIGWKTALTAARDRRKVSLVPRHKCCYQ